MKAHLLGLLTLLLFSMLKSLAVHAAIPATADPSPPAAAATAETAARTAGPMQSARRLTGTPTLGDWEDLTQRKAYQDQLLKLEAAESKSPSSAQNAVALPPVPLPPPGAFPSTTGQAKAKKKGRASNACRNDNSPCFFSVYGLSIDGVGNNYRGLIAIDGLVVNVHRGRQFRTRHNRYTVTSISTHELTAVDQAGRTHVWPYADSADVAAEPDELDSMRPSPVPLPYLRPFSVPQR